MIIEIFKSVGDVTPDGIHAVAACAGGSFLHPEVIDNSNDIAMGASFSKYLEEFWKILSHSLQRTSERELVTACIIAITEISRACPEQFSVFLPQLVPYLANKLNVSMIDSIS